MGAKHLTLRIVLKYTLVIGLVSFLIFYTLWQARLLIIGPVIDFTDDQPPTQTERVVEISGQAKNIVRITLNGRDIFTDTNGNFTEALVLESGYTIATIEGTDRYGRTATYERSFVYTGD